MFQHKTADMETFSFLTGRYSKVENLVLAQRFCQHNFAAGGHDIFWGGGTDTV